MDKNTSLRHVISVCAKKDAQTWHFVAPQILACIAADDYILIVPDSELADFAAMTPPQFTIAAESDYLMGWSLPMIQSIMPPGRENRAGWYLQQFIKISAMLRGNDQDVVLIWDADTMPLRPLNFIGQDGKLTYVKGSDQVTQPHLEHEQNPYFVTLNNLLGIGQQVDFSFIAQAFPCYVAWAREMIGAIEARHNCGWIEAILAAADLSKLSAFSEYETLGNYLVATHGSEIEIISRPWDHLGTIFIGIENMTAARRARFAEIYDFIAFEEWQKNIYFRPHSDSFFQHFFAGSLKKYLSILGAGDMTDFPYCQALMQNHAAHIIGRQWVTTDSEESAGAESQIWHKIIPNFSIEKIASEAIPITLSDYFPNLAPQDFETCLILVLSPSGISALRSALPPPNQNLAVNRAAETPLPSYIVLAPPNNSAEIPSWASDFLAVSQELLALGYRQITCDRMAVFIRLRIH